MTKHSREKGFSLIECLVAMVVTTVGLLSVAGMMSVGVRLQVESRDATAAGALGRAKLEELQNYAVSSSQRTRGGSLTSDVSGYNDVPDVRFKRRWLIESNPADAGIPAGTQKITVSVLPNRPDTKLPPVTLAVLTSAE